MRLLTPVLSFDEVESLPDAIRIIELRFSLTEPIEKIRRRMVLENWLNLSKLKIERPVKPKIYCLISLAAICSYYLKNFLSNDSCIIALPDAFARTFRPIQTCDFCRSVKAIDEIENVLPAEFEERYAYSGRPVIIRDATVNWTARDIFSFDYFRDLYLESDDYRANCQFFPYKTEFKSLKEAFRMNSQRAQYISGEPWYFGWSNCQPEIAQELRQHYSRPYFLPKNSENNAVDWIFMGGTGFGAHMHVDNVRLPSWQAQIKGSKVWELAPPPECFYQCLWFKVTVETGDTSKIRFYS